MKEKTIIIVGGGQAAAMAAASLRQQGFTGELYLFYSRCYPLTGGRKTMFICIPV